MTEHVKWEADKETYAEFKARKSAGRMGTGQPNSKRNSAGKCPNTNEIKTKCQCRTCINRRNRAKGRRKQNMARKLLKIPNNRFHGADAHEENWSTGLRVEVKAGKQVEGLSKVFYKSKKQSDLSHQSFGGSSKPFVQMSMPDNSSKGIISFETDNIENVCVEILKNFGYEFGDS